MEASLAEIQKDSSHRFSKLSEAKQSLLAAGVNTPAVPNWGVVLARSEGCRARANFSSASTVVHGKLVVARDFTN